MAAPNLFQELHDSLNDFKTFLDAHVGDIKPAIAPLDQLTGGRVTELINKLIDLMGKLKTEINNININNIPAIGQVTTFTQSITTLLTKAKDLMPNQAADIDSVLSVANVVTGLPSVDQLKGEIMSLIDGIVTDLGQLKA